MFNIKIKNSKIGNRHYLPSSSTKLGLAGKRLYGSTNMLAVTTTSALSLPTSNLVNNDRLIKRSFILQPNHQNTTSFLNNAYSTTALNTIANTPHTTLQAYRHLVADYF